MTTTVKYLTCFCMMVSVFAMPAQLPADYIYTLSGVIEAGRGAEVEHAQIFEGESWEANFLVDSSNLGGVGAVISGELTFSGGYVSPLDYSGFDIFVLNDFAPVGGGIFDIVRISTGFDQIFQANTADFSVLSGSQIPGPGVSFESGPDPLAINFGAFNFEDENGFVRYDSSQINNVVFTASVVPEPSSFAIITSIFGLVGIRRKRQG